MRYRQLGRSDLNVPVVMVGTWAVGGWCWGGQDESDSIRAIEAAIDCGMNAIDTAAMYGFGTCEEIVGRAIRGKRDKVIIATKCGLRYDKDEGEFSFETQGPDGKLVKVFRNLRRERIFAECEASLRRLGIDTIDLYQCHWPDSTTPLEETMSAMLELQEQGKIRHIGVSNFSAQSIEECLRYGRIESDQPRYNLLWRGIERDLVPTCRANEVGIITYSSLELGLLSGKVTMERKFPSDDIRSSNVFSPWFAPVNRKRVLEALDKIKSVADGHGVSLGRLAIAWTIAQPGITSAIVGVRNPEQAIENAAAGDIILTDEESAFIRHTFEDLGEPESVGPVEAKR